MRSKFWNKFKICAVALAKLYFALLGWKGIGFAWKYALRAFRQNLKYLQKVAYIGLRKKDGSYAVNIPLYVKLDEVDKKDMDESREEIIHKVTEIMMRRYEKQLAEIMNSKRPPPTETK